VCAIFCGLSFRFASLKSAPLRFALPRSTRSSGFCTCQSFPDGSYLPWSSEILVIGHSWAPAACGPEL
jgi:hypothetical protein